MPMDALSWNALVNVLQQFGFAGIILFLWWVDSRNIRKVLEAYRDDVASIRNLYENNARLVLDYEEACKRWEEVSKAMMEVVSYNTQTMAQLTESIKHNDYCPAVRKEGPNR